MVKSIRVILKGISNQFNKYLPMIVTFSAECRYREYILFFLLIGPNRLNRRLSSIAFLLVTNFAGIFHKFDVFPHSDNTTYRL